MKQDKTEQAVVDGITRFLKSDDGEALIGNIMLKALAQAMTREIRFEDGKSETGRVVERTESWNMVDWLVKYLPYIEGAIRGCQADSAAARNRSAEVRDMLAGMMAMLPPADGEILDATPPRPRLGDSGEAPAALHRRSTG